MEYRKTNDVIYLRIDKNEKIVETIKTVCVKEMVCGGHFQGIGACDSATLSTYLPDKNDFTDHTISGMIEMISLMGNISVDSNNEPFLHSHAVFSHLNNKGEIVVTAGHLKEANISYTGEIVITLASDVIRRKIDSETGIEVWKL
ncbi:MAG: PPC domain-containing DNA-binding protein [Candidatus Heteroscillospira sp.]|jgi:predicted DNA-binding protein with PD1-like motif